MKQWLLHNFELSTAIRIFGKPWSFRRAGRVLWPMFVLGSLVIMDTEPTDWALTTKDYIVLVVWAAGFYFGFLHYWIFGYKYENLDWEQQFYYLKGISLGKIKNPETGGYEGLTKGQIIELVFLTNSINQKYSKRYAGWKNLIYALGPVVITVIWYIIIEFLI